MAVILAAVAMCSMLAAPAAAQDQPYYAPWQLDRMVSRIALYPDPLLAQVLAAATFPEQIPDAAGWADQHRNMSGDELAYRIQDDQLPWDPSVQALLPFPSVLDAMASDMNWTSDLGNAFLSNQTEVMYAVQRMRRRARDYGYLRTGPQMVVSSGPYITIVPARPDYIVVPYYDPVVVYERPRPGFVIGAAIGFRFGVGLGVAFRPWGWGYNRISWNERVVVINNSPWHRTWVNRREYVHPYVIRRTVVVHEPPRREVIVKKEVIHEREVVHEHDRGNSGWAHEKNEERKEARREEEHREARHDAYRDDHRREADYRHDDHDRNDHGRNDHPAPPQYQPGHGPAQDQYRNDQGHVPVQNQVHDNHGNAPAQNQYRNNQGHDNHGHDKDKDHKADKDDHGNGHGR